MQAEWQQEDRKNRDVTLATQKQEHSGDHNPTFDKTKKYANVRLGVT